MKMLRLVKLKYVYRFICNTIFVFVATVFFSIVWYEFVRFHNQTGNLLGLGNLMMATGIYMALFVIIGRWLGAYLIGTQRMANLIASIAISLLLVDGSEIFVSMAITGQFRFVFVFFKIYFVMWFIQFIIIGIMSVLLTCLYRKLFKPWQLLEVYGTYVNELNNKVDGLSYKYHIAERINCTESEQNIREAINRQEAVIINDIPAPEKNKIVKWCFELDKRVYFVPKLSDIITKNTDEINLFDTPLFLSRNSGITIPRLIIKRLMDVVISICCLIAFSPIILIVAIAIKLEDGGPAFFRQERITKDMKKFVIFKFRSMVVDAEKDGRPHPAGEKDDRITKVGRIIRAFRIDELPQLINILIGDMSVVGPRPERIEHVEKYTSEIPEFIYRTKVKGGLTGYAQVYGKYNTSALDKLKLDLIYITNYSILLDIQILFETIKILFQKESTEGFSEEKIKEMHGADKEREN